jgi:outer membrane protein
MNNRIVSILVVIALGLGIFSVVYGQLTKPKIGYIKSQELFEGYEGMKEARAKYEEKVGSWQSNFDTLSRDYQQSLVRFDKDYNKLGAKEKAEKTQLLRSQMQNLEQYKQTIEEKAKKEDEALTQGIYNQVNEYIKKYGESHGYTIILGTTSNGNILYGKEHVDITEEVLKGLNSDYKGGAKK